MEKNIQEKLPQIKQLFYKYGVQSAYLFGSAATGKIHENSDYDFLFSFPIDMDYEVYADNYFQLLEALESLLKSNVDLVAEKTLTNPYLLEKINSQKIRII